MDKLTYIIVEIAMALSNVLCAIVLYQNGSPLWLFSTAVAIFIFVLAILIAID